MSKILGIDLGTTNTALAYLDTLDRIPQTQVLPIAQLEAPGKIKESDTLPSVCYLATGKETEEGALALPFHETESPAHTAVGAYAFNQCAALSCIRQIGPQVLHQRGNAWRTACVQRSALRRVFRKEKLQHVAGLSGSGQLSETVL